MSPVGPGVFDICRCGALPSLTFRRQGLDDGAAILRVENDPIQIDGLDAILLHDSNLSRGIAVKRPANTKYLIARIKNRSPM